MAGRGGTPAVVRRTQYKSSLMSGEGQRGKGRGRAAVVCRTQDRNFLINVGDIVLPRRGERQRQEESSCGSPNPPQPVMFHLGQM